MVKEVVYILLLIALSRVQTAPVVLYPEDGALKPEAAYGTVEEDYAAEHEEDQVKRVKRAPEFYGASDSELKQFNEALQRSRRQGFDRDFSLCFSPPFPIWCYDYFTTTTTTTPLSDVTSATTPYPWYYYFTTTTTTPFSDVTSATTTPFSDVTSSQTPYYPPWYYYSFPTTTTTTPFSDVTSSQTPYYPPWYYYSFPTTTTTTPFSDVPSTTSYCPWCNFPYYYPRTTTTTTTTTPISDVPSTTTPYYCPWWRPCSTTTTTTTPFSDVPSTTTTTTPFSDVTSSSTSRPYIKFEKALIHGSKKLQKSANLFGVIKRFEKY